ncbi:MAG: hypothetical protein PHF17_11295 [Arcobacteraceae bacterium]|nr:hypothetical protein [Arcobacteraceae bacterium]
MYNLANNVTVEAIKSMIPTVKTINETYNDDIGSITTICDGLNCDENELLMTQEEYELWMKYKDRDYLWEKIY